MIRRKKRIFFNTIEEYNQRNEELSAYVRENKNEGSNSQWYADPDFEENQRKIREHNEKAQPEDQVPYASGIWMDVEPEFIHGFTLLEKAQMVEVDIGI